jgi:hypothetical protein
MEAFERSLGNEGIGRSGRRGCTLMSMHLHEMETITPRVQKQGLKVRLSSLQQLTIKLYWQSMHGSQRMAVADYTL